MAYTINELKTKNGVVLPIWGKDFTDVIKSVNMNDRTLVINGTDESKDRDG